MPEPKDRRWDLLVVPLALAALAVAFWRFRIIAPANVNMFGASDDPYTQIYPMMARAADWIRHGQVPLWNPHQYAGHPFLATVLYGVFYPPNVLFLLLPTAYAIEASAVLHLFLAGLFTYAFLRSLDLAVPAALVGAFTYPLSGFFASQALWFLPAFGAAVWLPAGLLAIERMQRSRSLVWPCLLAVSVAMPVFAGWLQTWIYTMYGIGGYLAVRTLAGVTRASPRANAARMGLFGVGAVALGVCLAAVQLLPSFELQSLGPRRPGGLTVIQSLGMGPIPPARIFMGAVDPRPGFPRPSYVGDLWLLLAPATLLAARRVQAAFFWALGLFALGVALTVYTPIFDLYRLLPSSTWFRFPDRILVLYAFSSAVLLGMALDVFLGAGARSRRALAGCLAATVVATGLGLAVSLPLRAVVFLGSGLLLIWALWLFVDPRLRAAALAGLVLLQATDVFLATRSPALHPYHDVTPFDSEAEALEAIKARQEYWRTYIHYPATRDPGMMPKQGTLRGLYTITDYEPLSLNRASRFYRSMEGRQYNADSPPFVGITNVDPTPHALAFLDLLSVRFLAIDKGADAYRQALERAGCTPAVVPQQGRLVVYVNPRALPRAYVVSDARVVDSEDAAFAAISAPDFDPRRTVVLEGGTGGDTAPSDGADGGFPGATIESYEPTRVVVRVDRDAPGWLVLTDTWYPGWTATVDGQPATIERANYLFRAVRVTGRARVVFTFAPPLVRAGAALSTVALAVVGVALIVAWRRRP